MRAVLVTPVYIAAAISAGGAVPRAPAGSDEGLNASIRKPLWNPVTKPFSHARHSTDAGARAVKRGEKRLLVRGRKLVKNLIEKIFVRDKDRKRCDPIPEFDGTKKFPTTDWPMDHGVTQQTVKLKHKRGTTALVIATGNLGGGKPQPEFQGGNWENEFGPFEKLLGAMVLTTASGCPGEKNPYWGDKNRYERYYEGFNLKKCGVTTIWVEGIKYELPQTPKDVLADFKKMAGIVKELGGELPTNAQNFLDTPLKDIFPLELDIYGKGATFSKAEGCLKNRLLFPYFQEGFMKLATFTGEWEKLIKVYLLDLRGTTADFKELAKHLGKGIKTLLPAGQRENNNERFCSARGKNVRSRVFNENKGKDGEPLIDQTSNAQIEPLQWINMAMWDLYILKAFMKWKNKKHFEPLKLIDDDTEMEGVLRVARHFVLNTNIFFVQEAGKTRLCPKIQGKMPSSTTAYCGQDVDGAIFVDKKLHPEIKDVNFEYHSVIMNHLEEAKKYLRKSDTPFNPEKVNVPGVELAVFTLRSTKPTTLLLVSAHPDSDGIHCVMQLYLVKQLFVEKQKEWNLDFLIVGMDANVMTQDDFKNDKKGNGYNLELFEEKARELKFKVLMPNKATVHKQRTFLQTQLKKAGKLDKVKKDMVLIYSGTESEIEVVKMPKVVNEIRECLKVNKMTDQLADWLITGKILTDKTVDVTKGVEKFITPLSPGDKIIEINDDDRTLTVEYTQR